MGRIDAWLTRLFSAVLLLGLGVILLLAAVPITDAVEEHRRTAKRFKTVAERNCKILEARLNNGESDFEETDRMILRTYCNLNEWKAKP